MDEVVVFPCVPAIATVFMPRLMMPNTSARFFNGVPTARKCSNSAWFDGMAGV